MMRVSMPLVASGILLAGATGCGVAGGTTRTAGLTAGSVRSAAVAGCDGVAVGPAQEVVSVADRDRLGLDVWPDTALGVLKDGNGKYRFFSTGTPGSQGPQKVMVTGGTLDAPAADGLLSSRQVSNVPSGYDYVGGGPVYRDAQSGLVLEMLHLERPYGSDPSPFYTELHLGLVDPATGDVRRLGAIVQPDVDFTTAQRTRTTIDLGAPSFSVTDVGGTPYLYVYFADASGDAAHVSFAGLSAARAPLSEVLAAAKQGTVSAWTKYDGGQWTQPALGGASTDLNPDRPMAWAPGTARGAGRTLMVAGESPHDMVLSTSADGVSDWSARHPLWRDPDLFDAYPTVVADGDGAPNAPGDTFFVYYTQWQSTSPVWSTARLMRRTVRCTEGMSATDVPLVRYSDGTRHQVTTGPAPAGYHEEGRWYLRSAQEPGTVAVYGCRNGEDDQFLYEDANCGGSPYAILQTEGWIYTAPPQAPSVPLYRCHVAGIGDHFVSVQPDCEAPGNPNVVQEGLLGYAKTQPQ